MLGLHSVGLRDQLDLLHADTRTKGSMKPIISHALRVQPLGESLLGREFRFEADLYVASWYKVFVTLFSYKYSQAIACYTDYEYTDFRGVQFFQHL